MEKLRFGVFGTWRGLAFIKALAKIDEAEVVAICDKDEKRIQEALPHCPADVKICKDFDELIASGIDAVVLGNYFNEHTPFAIRAMRSGVDVLSETTAAYTLRECVELVEAVEETGRTYALAENYPFFRACREITHLYQTGVVGSVLFAEGEYVHPMSEEEHQSIMPEPTHWRNGLPNTYYCTHSLAPLMTATGLMPKKVIGKVTANCAAARQAGKQPGEPYDRGGILLLEMEQGVIFRVGGDNMFGSMGNWYRISCEGGNIESVRGGDPKVRLSINPWALKKDSGYNTENVYTPAETELDKKAEGAGHGGSDFFVTYNFVQDLLHKRQPFMNVYRAVALSAVGILGWRSALNNSVQLDIPDFRKKEDRDRVRNDTEAPQPHYGQEGTLPRYIHVMDKAE
ncbi:MAG: Gfo/Idh/MocA family oxidoreductase [Oscillospiraceae bacterium]|nr:Gfo/Idh/MocA family oxidoreductase [Oscillospiraceae bacterium]